MSNMPVSTHSSSAGFQAIIPGTCQKISFDSSTACTNPLKDTTKIVRLISDQNCYVAFGSSPTATSSSMYLAAGIPEYFGVTPGDKIAALKVSTAGILYITEGA